jgi:hypothetical protein
LPLHAKRFDNLCTNVRGVSDNDALLDFLLLNGVVFYRSGLFGESIVLDQNWMAASGSSFLAFQ